MKMKTVKREKRGLLGSKKGKLTRLKKVQKKPTKGRKAVQKGVKVKPRRNRATSYKAKKDKKVRILKRKEEEEPIIEHFPSDGFMNFQNQVEISKEDEQILEQFQITQDFTNEEEPDSLIDQLQTAIDINLDVKKQADYKENILNDPNVKLVYTDIAKIMKEYTSGKVAKPFKVIPMLDHWEKVLQMTKPEEWSPHAMFAATRLFSSSLDIHRAKTFYEKYLLPAVREDIKKHKKLNYHYYQALIKAFYKPSAWIKGLLFALCKSQNCSIKEAQIFGSILSKLSIPVVHSSVAILKIAELGFTGPTAIFIKTLLEKKYALPTRVINALVAFFLKYEQTELVLPVVFYQLVLRVCELYSSTMDEMQKTALKSLVKKKKHPVMTPLVLAAIDNLTKKDIAENNLAKSLLKNEQMIIE